MTNRAGFSVFLLALLLVGSTTTACAAVTTADRAPAPPGARVLTTRQVQGRTWDLTVDSPALGKAVNVRLLLPVRHDADPTRRWPVLYLLHGCCDDYLSWTRSTDIEPLSRNADLLVVMPEGGSVGFYSDWLQGPGWETFHTVELPALLAAGYRAGDRQAVAGVSMGGLGALDYAAHHPGRFTAAASFSGIVHTRLSEDVTQDYRGLLRSQGADPDALWGNPFSDVATWARHNPYDLAGALRGTRLFLSAGDGRPGPLDPPGDATAPADSIETSISAQNHALVERLRELGIAAQADLYAAGTHNWVYWQRELHRAWPLLTTGLLP
jgi:diacylglycerol O-acyltransferase / trehalose O-mycolyltransferase